MSRVVQFMRDLVDKGMSWEDAALFAERFEESIDDALAVAVSAKPKSSSAERQARYRERKRNGDVTSVTQRETQQGDVTPVAKDAAAHVHTRGENNLSRLVDTCSAAVVAEAREPGFDWPKGKAADHAKLLVELTANRCLDPSRQQLLVTTTGRLEAWRRDGASWEHDVVPVVTTIARARGSPIKSWKFFDDAIAQSIADNRRALTIPPANGNRHERPDQPSAKFSAKQANMERAFRGAQAVIARRSV